MFGLGWWFSGFVGFGVVALGAGIAWLVGFGCLIVASGVCGFRIFWFGGFWIDLVRVFRFWCLPGFAILVWAVRCWLRICLFSCLTWVVEFGLGWVVSAERWLGAFWVITDVLFALVLGCW